MRLPNNATRGGAIGCGCVLVIFLMALPRIEAQSGTTGPPPKVVRGSGRLSPLHPPKDKGSDSMSSETDKSFAILVP
jgi:hypothetical protein